MIERCTKEYCISYKNYGGRGIRVCDRWMSFEPFLEDMGRRPSAKHSLDRIDCDGNYEPGNCRWATPRQQSANKRTSVKVVFQGQEVTLTDLSDRLGLSTDLLRSRLRQGKPLDDPKNSFRKRTKLSDEQVREIRASTDIHRILAERYGVGRQTVSAIKSGSERRSVK